jgi:hypothetical protein
MCKESALTVKRLGFGADRLYGVSVMRRAPADDIEDGFSKK